MQNLSFYVWLISLRLTPSRSTHTVVNCRLSFLKAKYDSTVHIHHIFYFTQSHTDQINSRAEKQSSDLATPSVGYLLQREPTQLNEPPLLPIKWPASRNKSPVCPNKDLRVPLPSGGTSQVRGLCLLEQGAPARRKYKLKHEMKTSKHRIRTK